MSLRVVPDRERRARLAVRHALAPEARVAGPVAAAEAVVALHATDPASVHVSALARCPALTAGEVEAALYDDRSLVKHLAMRRTQFVFPRATLPVAQAVCGARVERGEVRGLLRDVARSGLHADPAGWLAACGSDVLAVLADGVPRTLDELRAEVPALAGATEHGQGRSWGGRLAVGPRVLTILSARGLVVRGPNDGHWRGSRHRWVSMAAWLGEPLPVLDPEEAEAALVAAWLRGFGPGTERDLRWWLGSTLAVVRRALAAVGAVPVELGAGEGWLLPDDLEQVEAPGPWVALLPPLDPTVMGWQERGWYVGPHGGFGGRLFDSVGNAGPSAWVDGRVVGTWHQEETGEVTVVPFEKLTAAAARRLAAEGERVAAYCDGVRVVRPYPPQPER